VVQPGEALRQILGRIDGRPYGAYRDLTGAYRFARYVLYVDHVQPDPYAPPSRLRVAVPASEAGLPAEAWQDAARRVALEDWLLRRLARALARAQGVPVGAEAVDEAEGSELPAGCLRVLAPGQQVLPRSAVSVRQGAVEVRLGCELPAQGRTVLGGRAAAALDVALPQAVAAMLPRGPEDLADLQAHIALYEDQEFLRAELRRRGWVAFLADGSILPRRAGGSDLPLERERAVPLAAPDALAATVELPHRGPVRGLAIPEGVTVVVGGAYHGKTTLLRALEHGVYNHVAGDGRELCVTREDAVAVLAEDGRAVTGVDIGALVRPLPGGVDTRAFTTRLASGSTSQAAAVMEAWEQGAGCLLVDEDRSAANFMSRDARMRLLVPDAEDPVVPFAERVRELWERAGISTVLVAGGAGAFLAVADRVIRMRAYRPEDVTEEARAVVARTPDPELPREERPALVPPAGRVLTPDPIPYRGRRLEVRVRGPRTLSVGGQLVDLGALPQLVDPAQVRALADMLPKVAQYADGRRTLAEAVAEVFQDLDRLGFAAISPWPGGCPGDYARPRPFEVSAVLSRVPGLGVAGVSEPRPARRASRGRLAPEPAPAPPRPAGSRSRVPAERRTPGPRRGASAPRPQETLRPAGGVLRRLDPTGRGGREGRRPAARGGETP
jgi:predicted ABC-class ATPase